VHYYPQKPENIKTNKNKNLCTMFTTMKFPVQRSAYSNPFCRPSFDDLFFGKEFSADVPSVNIIESEKSWDIEVAAPGFKKEDFKIRLEKDVLTVSAEVKQENKTEEKNYSRREFRTASFSRSFRMPKEKVNEEGINAAYENGILLVSIPKKEAEQPAPKEIKIS